MAQDFDILNRNKITHIVNCATGVRNLYPKNFAYLKLDMMDLPSENIRKHLILAIQFMDQALQAGGKVRVRRA